MEKIAMKCTREQYESIKEFIGDLKDTSIGDFVKYNYLVNNYCSRVHSFGMLQEPADFRLKYETFDKDIFLKACGIETPKILIDYNPKGHWIDEFVKSIEVELTREEIEKILGYKIKIVK